MRYPYKTILCPVDFDANSQAAVAHARRIAIDADATLHLLHVLPILPLISDRGSAGVDQEAESEARGRLKEIARHLSRTRYQIHTRIGFVSEVPKNILTAARELGADLIVMATHGRSAIRHLFFGSVAEAVVRNAVCPVLTLRPAAEAEGGPSPKTAKSSKPASPAP
jgi:universal stress protein A